MTFDTLLRGITGIVARVNALCDARRYDDAADLGLAVMRLGDQSPEHRERLLHAITTGATPAWIQRRDAR
jgi:hypothetical protein